ncbi:hypothetical protein D3C86_1645960 [compost metagenome]
MVVIGTGLAPPMAGTPTAAAVRSASMITRSSARRMAAAADLPYSTAVAMEYLAELGSHRPKATNLGEA